MTGAARIDGPPSTDVAAIAAGAYTGGMSDSEKPLREQLDEAIDKVRRELEILHSPSSIGGGSNDGSVIADLEKELRELQEARFNVGAHDT